VVVDSSRQLLDAVLPGLHLLEVARLVLLERDGGTVLAVEVGV
jgi:hypothetical protein